MQVTDAVTTSTKRTPPSGRRPRMVRSVLKPESGFAGGACTPLLTVRPLKRASSATLYTTGLFRVQTTTVQCSTRTSVGRCAWITLSESHGGLTGQLAISTIRRTYRRTDASCGVHVSRDPSRGPFLERDWRLSCLSFLCLYISTQLQPAALRPSFRVRAPPARPARIRVTGATGACSSAEARARDVVVANESRC